MFKAEWSKMCRVCFHQQIGPMRKLEKSFVMMRESSIKLHKSTISKQEAECRLWQFKKTRKKDKTLYEDQITVLQSGKKSLGWVLSTDWHPLFADIKIGQVTMEKINLFDQTFERRSEILTKRTTWEAPLSFTHIIIETCFFFASGSIHRKSFHMVQKKNLDDQQSTVSDLSRCWKKLNFKKLFAPLRTAGSARIHIRDQNLKQKKISHLQGAGSR